MNGDGRDGFAGLDACVRCGFCLQACPTYLATGDEADGPRGRIALMREMEGGGIARGDPILHRHLDRCLGCRGCEPACPSGVGYGSALQTARERLTETRGVALRTRVLTYLFANEQMRRAVMRPLRLARSLLPRSAPRAPLPIRMLAATRPRSRARPGVPPTGSMRALLFRGCVMDDLFSHVHAATQRVLTVNGYKVLHAPGEACCGALHLHAGLPEEARALARQNARAFTGTDAIVVNSAGCGAALREYGSLLPEQESASALADRAVDVSVALTSRGPRRGGPLRLRVAYDPPCHLLHAQGVADEPLTVLQAIDGLTLATVSESEQCCGAAGLYSLLEPELSRDVLNRKIERIVAATPDVVASGNPGCIMQLGAGLAAAGCDIPVRHPVELLDDAYAAAGYY
jgi:glycolate oxidase iron-sulfur subunit